MKNLPLVVIVGPTASGKTGLAIKLAKKVGGEIICADSRTIYRGMDIGTAKPDLIEQDGVAHWGIDVAEPSDRYTARQFQEYAYRKIDEIRARGHIPFLVGGTGLYVDCVIYRYEFPKPLDPTARSRMEGMTRQELYEYCINNNIELPINDKNKRHLVHAIAHKGRISKRNDCIDNNTIVVGISTEKNILLKRIQARTEVMFASGVIDEARNLSKKFGWDAEAMKSNVYRSINDYLEGRLTLEETKESFRIRDWQLAKRQLTWFRRRPETNWLPLDEAYTYLAHEIARRSES